MIDRDRARTSGGVEASARLRQTVPVRSLSLPALALLASCHWIFPYASPPADSSSSADRIAAERFALEGSTQEGIADSLGPDAHPRCTPQCTGVQVCCSKNGAPVCVNIPQGCECNPTTGDPCGGIYTCCDTGDGSGPQCRQNAYLCICDSSAACGVWTCCDGKDGLGRRCHTAMECR